MSEALLVVIGLGLIAGGAIVVIDSLIIRRLRAAERNDHDERQT